MRRGIVMAAVAALLFPALLSAQGNGWAQFSVAGGYAGFSKMYEKSGSFYTVDMEAHLASRVYGSLLVGMSRYEGSTTTLVEYADGAISDGLSDKRTEIMFGVGPGFDLLSNHIDRFYLNLYAGYAVVKRESEYYEGRVKQFPEDNLNGVFGMARLGYEHQFGSSFVLGAFAQGAYSGEAFNWGVGLRLGFRTGAFGVKKPAALYK